MKINIIDPVSTEFNRGSFCYAPYLIYNGLKSLNPRHEINLMEGFCTENIDTIPEADVNIVCLWSYPQIDACMLIAHMLPMNTGMNNVYFVGYTELIKEYGLPLFQDFFGYDPLSTGEFLGAAMRSYPKFYPDFKYLLLSDCDMHIKSLDKGEKVYPLFTSYGCPNGCSFCPSTVNCDKKRFVLSSEETISLLEECKEGGYTNIHLTDEDFFFDSERAFSILNGIKGLGLHLIALGAADAVLHFVETYGTDVIKEAGLEVIEIGFESGDSKMSASMGTGKNLTSCEKLAEMQNDLPFSIFWLVLTFYIGETIKSLNSTGSFMRKYGLEQEQVVGRLRTNGTKGGLGQFFQPYHGTPLYKVLPKMGEFLPLSGARLMPTYIPDSFKNSKILSVSKAGDTDYLQWLELYSLMDVHTRLFKHLEVGTTIDEYLNDCTVLERQKVAMYFAILARMEVIC